VLVVDGLEVVRRALDVAATAAEHDQLDGVLTSGAVVVVAGVEQVAALPGAFLARCPHRWLLHLHDAHDAALLGLTAAAVPGPVPGQVTVCGSGLAGQLVEPGKLPLLRVLGPRSPAVPAIDEVPPVVHPGVLPAARHHDAVSALPIGIDFIGGSHAFVEVPDGEHLLVLGPARSGRSATLTRLAFAWRGAHPVGWVGALLPRRSGFDEGLADWVGTGPTCSADLVAHVPSDVAALLLVDDAELLDDPGGRLTALAGSGRVTLTIAAAGRADALRQTYGHWTAVVRRSRLGIIHAGGGELDGDLLGCQLPRRAPIAPRPGLAWVVAHGRQQLVQVAWDGTLRVSARRSAH
jgi:S-DNA-T family DNA segregation ATPase FtsK/SpoIIIE